jgi:BarA-like signal transduction histidine kinase
MVRIYNPVSGALFEFDETHPVDAASIGAWELSYASPDRGLTQKEITQLKTQGKIGTYPDEFFLVDSSGASTHENVWPLDKALRHQRAIRSFERVNENGPPFPHWDHISKVNKREKIMVNFVPGPIVDSILASSRESAIDHVYRMMLTDAASTFRTMKTFQEKALEHARNLVDAVRDAAGRNGLPNNAEQADEKMTTGGKGKQASSTVRDRILAVLASEHQSLLPIDIAEKAGLNRHTVRRELQQMLNRGLVTRNRHQYSRQREALQTCTTSSPT